MRIVIVLFLVAVLSPLGTDYLSYHAIYNSLQSLSDYVYMEPGFRMLVLLSHLIGANIQGFYLIITVLTLVPVLYVLRSGRTNTSFLYYNAVFFFPYIINGIRQSLAMGIGILAIHMFRSRRIKFSIFFLLLSFTIHYGAIFFIIYFVFQLRRKWLSFPLLALILLGVYYYAFWMMNPGYSSIGLFDLLYRLALVIIMVFLLEEANKDLLGFYVFGFLLYILFYNDSQLAARVHFYFRVAEVLIFSEAIKKITLSRLFQSALSMVFLVLNLIIYV